MEGKGEGEDGGGRGRGKVKEQTPMRETEEDKEMIREKRKQCMTQGSNMFVNLPSHLGTHKEVAL